MRICNITYLDFLFPFIINMAHIPSIARITIPPTAAITAIVLPDMLEDSEPL